MEIFFYKVNRILRQPATELMPLQRCKPVHGDLIRPREMLGKLLGK